MVDAMSGRHERLSSTTKLSANKELHNCVSSVVYRQTNKMGRFDLGVLTLGRFDLGRFDSGTFWLGTFWLWDILTLGRFNLGRFDFGTFWLGTFWLWDVLTWDVLTLGRFDLGHFDFETFWLWDKKCLLSRVWLNTVKIYLGRFDSPKMGRFGKSLGTFWFWDVLTGYQGVLWNIRMFLCMSLCALSGCSYVNRRSMIYQNVLICVYVLYQGVLI